MEHLPDLTITVTKTADGQHDYVQIITLDQFALNIVLIAGKIAIVDARPKAKPSEGPGKG